MLNKKQAFEWVAIHSFQKYYQQLHQNSIEEYEISGVERSDSTLKSQGSKKLTIGSSVFKPALKVKVEPFKPSSSLKSNVNISQSQTNAPNYFQVSFPMYYSIFNTFE